MRHTLPFIVKLNLSMHQTVKTLFRLFFAMLIFLITLALFISLYAKGKEIINAEQAFQQAKIVSLKSNPQQQLVLLSNNQGSQKLIYILLAHNGYVAKVRCEHYLTDICTDAYNDSHTRQIRDVDLLTVNQHSYIKKVNYQDSLTQQQQQWSYVKAQIRDFYQADILTLKYIVFSILLFALAALYVCIRIIKNFKTFLTR